MKKNLLLTLLFILASCAIATAKNDGPKIQGWIDYKEYKESPDNFGSLIFGKYSANGKKLFALSSSGVFYEIDVLTGEKTREINTNVYSPRSADYEEDGDILVFSSQRSDSSNIQTLTCFQNGILKFEETININPNKQPDPGYTPRSIRDASSIIKINKQNGLIFRMISANYQRYYQYTEYFYTEGLFSTYNLSNGQLIKNISSNCFDQAVMSPDKQFLILNRFDTDCTNYTGHAPTNPFTCNYGLFKYEIEKDTLVVLKSGYYHYESPYSSGQFYPYFGKGGIKDYEDIEAISNDSKSMISITNEDSVIYRNMSDSKITNKFYATGISTLRQSKNVKMLISLNGNYDNSNLISMYDYNTGELRGSIRRPSFSYEGWIMDLSPDSSSIAVYGTDGKIKIYSPKLLYVNKNRGFTTQDTVYHVDDTIKFEDKSLNSPNTWTWDFGDGSTSNLQNPEHIYSKVGNYSVRLITDNGKVKDTAFVKDYITIIPALNPIFNVSFTSEGVPLEAKFSFSCNFPVNFYTWDFGDGSKLENTTEPSILKTYKKIGKFLPKILFNDGYHDHIIAIADSIEVQYPKPEAFDVLFEQSFIDKPEKNTLSCGFVANNGDLVFGMNTYENSQNEPANDGGNVWGRMEYYPSEIYRYDLKGNHTVLQFNNGISNIAELSNGDYFLIGSFDYTIPKEHYNYPNGYYDHRC